MDVLPQENVFMKKYLSLRNKCEQLQQVNLGFKSIHHKFRLFKKAVAIRPLPDEKPRRLIVRYRTNSLYNTNG